VLGGSVSQRHRRSTSYRERKRRSLGTHLLAQSTGGAIVEKKEGGGFNGADHSRFGGNRSRARRRRGEGKRRRRWGVLAHGGAGGGEARPERHWPGLFMSVPAARYFSPAEVTPWGAHVPNPLGWFTTVWACPHVWLRELGLAHGGTVGCVRCRVSREVQ